MFREIGDLTVLAAVADGKAEFIPTAAALVPFLEGRAAEAASSDFDEHRDEVQVRLVADLVVRSRAPPKQKQECKWGILNEKFWWCAGAHYQTALPNLEFANVMVGPSMVIVDSCISSPTLTPTTVTEPYNFVSSETIKSI